MSDKLFSLRVPLSDGHAMIYAYDGGNHPCGGWKIDVEVRHKGKVIFPLGPLYCGTPACGGMSLDGIEAKEMVMSLVGIRPGDTDAEYFKDYTQEQLDWANSYGEQISSVRYDRFCYAEENIKRRRKR